MSQFIRKLLWHFCGGDNYLLDYYNSKQIAKYKLSHYYSMRNVKAKRTHSRKLVIAMCDGRDFHGGLSDRLRGIVSLYTWCKENGFDFKIHFTSPFLLVGYLEPNKYDWVCTDDELSYNSKESTPILINTKRQRVNDLEIQQRRLEYIKKSSYKQYHVYTNTYIYESAFKVGFHELFKTSEVLQRELDYHKKKIGGKYIAVTFRFQQLLGDFREDGCKVLSTEQRIMLLNQCLKSLDDIYEKMENKENKMLVTSDSITFLESAKNKDYTYIIPGEIVHMDSTDANENVHLKTFVDLLMISGAEKAHLVVGPDMYNGGFAQRGAMISGIPYEVIYL